MTASASFSSASARLAIASASARPLARIDAPSASPRALVASPSAMPRGGGDARLGLADLLDLLRLGGGRELDLARLRLGDRDARDALGLGLDLLLVGGGVGRLAHLRVEPLLLALGLEVGDLGLLHDDLLARLGVGQRAGLGGLRRLLVDLRLIGRALDLGVAPRGGLQRLGLLLALGRLAVGGGLRDARLHLTSAARGSPSARM